MLTFAPAPAPAPVSSRRPDPCGKPPDWWIEIENVRGVSLGEWRTLALLGAEAPQTVNRLARLAGLDKAQMSRVVSKLADRGLVSRTLGPGRTTELSLTADGDTVYRGLITAANERNEAFLACLDLAEREALASALTKLTALARSLERAER